MVRILLGTLNTNTAKKIENWKWKQYFPFIKHGC